MWVFLVGTEDRANNLDFVAEALGEGRAQWAVNQTANQNCLVRNLAFTTEERTGNLARGVRALFDVNGQWEKVDTVTYGTCGGNGCQQNSVTDLGNDGSVGELGETTGFE